MELQTLRAGKDCLTEEHFLDAVQLTNYQFCATFPPQKTTGGISVRIEAEGVNTCVTGWQDLLLKPDRPVV